MIAAPSVSASADDVPARRRGASDLLGGWLASDATTGSQARRIITLAADVLPSRAPQRVAVR